MPDDTTLRKPGEGASKEVVEKKVDVTTEKVGDDSSNKIAEIEARRVKDKAEADAKIAKLEFENEFKDIVSTYPYAADLRDKIQEKVNAGIPIKDAAITVLHSEGKLETREQITSANAGQESLGGSTDIQAPKGSKRIEEMSTEEMRAALVAEEAKGTFKLVDG
jgi:hypothetical protein